VPIAIWVDDHKAMLIRQLVEFVASPLTHRLRETLNKASLSTGI
jgi:hypothetical protein